MVVPVQTPDHQVQRAEDGGFGLRGGRGPGDGRHDAGHAVRGAAEASARRGRSVGGAGWRPDRGVPRVLPAVGDGVVVEGGAHRVKTRLSFRMFMR